jgi:MFS family permease
VQLPAHREDPSVHYVAGSLVLGVFFGGVAGGVAFPTLPLLGPVLGISPLLVGVILSVNRFTRLLMNTPAGSLLDRMGTRRPMVAGFAVMATAPFGYAVGMSPEAVPLPIPPSAVFVVSRVAWGVGSAFVFVGAFATITHVTTPENRGRWTGYMRGGQSLGFPAGLVVGGLVADAAGIREAFLLAGAAGLLSTLVATAVLPDVSPDVEQTAGLRELPGLVRADSRVLVVGTVNAVVRFLFAGVLLSTVVLYAAENEVRVGALSEVGVSGALMAFGVVFSSAATVVVSRYSDRLENRAVVTLPSLGSLGAGFLVLAGWPTLPGTAIGVALVGLGVGGTNPPLLAYLGDISPDEDVGKLGGVYNVFGDVGSTAGPVVALPLASVIGFPGEYLLCALLVVGAGALVAGTLLRADGVASAAPVE